MRAALDSVLVGIAYLTAGGLILAAYSVAADYRHNDDRLLYVLMVVGAVAFLAAIISRFLMALRLRASRAQAYELADTLQMSAMVFLIGAVALALAGALGAIGL